MSSADHLTMPIAARPLGPDFWGKSWVEGDAAAGTTSPPRVLLPSGGPPGRVPAPMPPRALALDALLLLRRFRGTAAADAVWSDPAFGRQVEAIRSQLAPIRSRRALTASFWREAAHIHRPILVPDGRPLEPPGPLRLAYAIRWLELGDGELRPGWMPIVRGHDRARRRVAGSRRRPPAVLRACR